MATWKLLLLCSMIALGSIAAPAAAEVNFSIGIDIAPPPARVEVVPPPRVGYVWAPGYWGWDGNRHAWIEGRWVASRPGYYWVPERWERHAEERHHHWHFEPGRWEREHGRWDHASGRIDHERR